jgi:hypothetical protein
MIEGIMVGKNPKNGFTTVRLHYTSVPMYRSEEWKKRAMFGYSKDAWEQEMEINFTLAGTNKVYPEFNYERHVKKLRPVKDKGLLVGWDYGYHHPAVVICQIDSYDTVCILDEVLGTNITIQNFTKEIIGKLNRDYGHWYKRKIIEHFGDPAGNQQNDKSEFTSMQIQRKMGIFVKWKRVSVKQGIRTIQNLLSEREDGTCGLKVDPRCQILIDGFLGGYIEQPVAGEKQLKELPYGDDYYSHNQDALRYIIINKFPAHGIFYKKRNIITDAGVYNPFEDNHHKVDDQSSTTGYY